MTVAGLRRSDVGGDDSTSFRNNHDDDDDNHGVYQWTGTELLRHGHHQLTAAGMAPDVSDAFS